MKAPYRILNASADETMRTAVSRMLGECGWEVMEAGTGRQVWEKVRRDRPDLVVMDMRLPDTTGPAVCSRLQGDPLTASLPVVLLSAVGRDDDTWVDGLSQGAMSCLTWPLSPEVLTAQGRALVQNRRNERLLARIGEGLFRLTGRDLFFEAIKFLAEEVGADYCFIGASCSDKPGYCRTVAVWGRSGEQPPFEYRLTTTPCGSIYGKEARIIPDGVREAFPDSPLLRIWEARGFMGEPLFDGEQRPIGVLCAAWQRPIDPGERDRSLFRLLAGRVALELERERTEQRLREEVRLLELADEAIAVRTLDGKVSFWNQGAAKLTGCAASDALGRRFDEILKLDQQQSEAVWKAVLEQGGWNGEVEVGRQDGERLTLILRQRLLRDAEGRPERVLSVATDITELQRMRAQQMHSDRLEAIGTLAGGVAHEINNPINGVMNYAELIGDELPADSPALQYVEEIKHETNRIAVIVRNLLAYARHDKQEHSAAPVREIVEGTVSLVRTVIKRDRITLQVELPDELPVIKCRSQQIQQVLMNLLTNGRDALNEKYPGYDPDKVLRLTAATFNREGRDWVRITVEDHGPGVPPEVQARMYEPFFTTKPQGKGTGLGMSIIQGIVEAHHGKLNLETEPGQFARFHLELPVDNGWEIGGDDPGEAPAFEST